MANNNMDVKLKEPEQAISRSNTRGRSLRHNGKASEGNSRSLSRHSLFSSFLLDMRHRVDWSRLPRAIVYNRRSRVGVEVPPRRHIVVTTRA